MPGFTFPLRGWHALVGVAVGLAVWGLQVYTRVVPEEEAMRAAVKAELLNEYSGRGRKDVARLVAEAREGSSVEPVPELVQHDVEFRSIRALGKMGDRVDYVRVEITVEGAIPPDGRPVRYFRISRKFMDPGWMVIGPSDSYSYYSQLIP
jgi:hypothetical protein